MTKDRKITMLSIIAWAVCIIILFGYYTFAEGNEKSRASRVEDNEAVIENNIQHNDKYEARARELMSNMTLSQKVGQMFFVRCPESNALSVISEYKIGAFILFARDFEGQTKKSIRNKLTSYQNKARIPLLIGVDEEGGTVTRVSRFKAFRSEKFKSPMELYNKGGQSAIENDTDEKCRLLKSLGINVNFAPVCDISTDKDSYIYGRTLGQDKEITASYAKQMVYQMNKLKVGSVLKHFPGYGDAKDTHVTSYEDNRSLNEFMNNDFVPFKEGIKAGARCILVAHNKVKSVDSENVASLSEKMHEILREELGFDGVIISDDLDMKGIDADLSDEQLILIAVEAGNDMVITSNYKEQITALKNAVSNGDISEDRINESVVRILSWKMSLGLL